MYLIRKHTHELSEIGRFLGNKNHSTVLMAPYREMLKRMARSVEDVSGTAGVAPV